MAKKKRKPAAEPIKAPSAETAGESRASVAVTVAWMLSLLVTLAANAIAVPAAIIAKAGPAPAETGISTAHVADLFLFVGLITGLLTAGLVPVVYRVREIPPPRSIATLALVAGAIAPITMVLRWLF